MSEPTNTTQLAVVQTANQDNSSIGDVKVGAAHEDPFWSYADLAEGQFRWNKTFPYRLCLWKKEETGWDQNYETLTPFTLPIAPENLTISTPFAITTTVTLGGIVEEHNGAPLRTITITGTTGVLPLRGQVAGAAITRAGPSLPSSIFAGTLSGVTALGAAVQQLGTGKGATNALVDDNSDEATSGTGYAQFKLLQRFLEIYITFKKTAAGRNTVLALELWKDQEIYFVSPVSFELRRSAQSPLEYQYSMVFKAWKRVLPGMTGGGQISGHNPAPDLNKLAKAMNTLEAARGVLEGARKVLTGLRADINESLFNPIRECTTFIKDLLGVALTAADLPASIVSDLKGPITAASGIAGALSEFGGLGNRYKAAGEGLVNAARDTAQAFQNLSISSGTAQTGGGQQPDTGSSQQGLEDGNPAHKASANPDDSYEFFKTIKPGELNLSAHTQKRIDDEKRRLRLLKREDFEERRDLVANTLTEFQDSIGIGNETFSRVYGLEPRAQLREASESDYDVIFAINSTIMEMNRLVVSSKINQDEVAAIDYIAGLASRSGIAFTTPRSKFLVPFPYGHTLEQVSLMYLNTPDRWHEIATLNGLSAPYVDEVGFSLPLLTNGNGNTVTVSDSTNLFVNQPVWLSSVAVGRIKRRITKIDILNAGLVAVTVDGTDDLAQFTVGAGAILQAFLPNTVNSQQSIFIPSDEEVVEEDYRLKSVPGVDYFDPLLRVGGIDLLLTSSGDLVITPDGDTRLAVGLTNIVQKVRLVIDTVRGSLLHHPDYGFPLKVGDSTADLSAKDILRLCKGLFRDDPTFTGVESAAILKDGPLCKITLSVGISGTQQVIPITVEIPR
jgi:hypothetical protein